MAYDVQALIAGRTVLGPVARSVQRWVVDLEAGLALLPLGSRIGDEDWLLLEGQSLPEGLALLCREASSLGPIAYVECECVQGPCWQASIVWRDGEIALGPLVDPGWDLDPPPGDPRDGPINRALRALGVVAPYKPNPWNDEFELVGLRRFRFTEDWLEVATPL